MFPALNQDSPTSSLHKVWSRFTTKDWILVCCMSLGFIFVISGIVLQFLNVDQAVAKSTSASQPYSSQKIYVDVGGAVNNPGIYELEVNSRIATALTAAGGVNDLADTEYLAQSVNLSKTLSDEEKIYIPVSQPSTSQTNAKKSVNDSMNDSNNLVSINTASNEELEALPKIGKVTAQKIIGGRPYLSINELSSKKVVSEGVFNEISKLISI